MSRILPSRSTGSTWLPTALLAIAWTLSAVIGWVAFRLLGGPGLSGPAAAGVFEVGMLLAVGLAIVLTRLLGERGLAGVSGWVAMMAIGWGAATAAGWTLAVEVGGPLIGLATGLAVAGAAVEATTGSTVRRVAIVGVAALVAVPAWRLLPLDLSPPVGLVVSVVIGLAVVVAGRWALVPALPLTPVVVLVVGSGVAWVGAWIVSGLLLPLVFVIVSIAVEILLAVALGAAVLGLCQRGPQGEPVDRVVLRWTAAAVGGLVVAVLLAMLAAALLPVQPGELPGPIGFLDLGTTVGLGATAWYACRSTLGRPLRWSALRPR